MQRRDRVPARVEVAPVAGRVLEPAQLRDLVAQLHEQPFDLLFLSPLRFVAHRRASANREDALHACRGMSGHGA
jgi:hypothetical protein